MADLLFGVAVWFGLSFVAVLMFALGAALGRRGAWEDGYELGQRVGEARARGSGVRAGHGGHGRRAG